jgi:predicted N-acyltransferase
MRRGVQFHWFNRGFADFDDFLAGFTSAKRKKLKRERRAVTESGLRLEVRHGDEIDDALWLAIHRQYRNTFIRYGNHPAFPVEFFPQVARQLGRQLVLFPRLRGRYSNGIRDLLSRRRNPLRPSLGHGSRGTRPALRTLLLPGHRVLHPPRLARLRAWSPGRTQACARLRTGATWSGFWIADPRMRRAVADFIDREDAAMQDYEAETAGRLPFRRDSRPAAGDENQ